MAGHLDPTEEAVLIQFAFVAVSILTAWIVLHILKGSAEIKHKGIQFGGSAAMFVAVFLLLNKYTAEIQAIIEPQATNGTQATNDTAVQAALPSAPVLQVRAATPRFRVGERLDMRIKVLRQSYLFCFILDHAGTEAALLYPAQETDDNRFGSSDKELKYPDDFKSSFPVRLDRPTSESFHCVATGQPLQDPLKKQWFDNTADLVKKRNRSENPSISASKTEEVLSGLRKSDGAFEASTGFVAE